MYDFENNGLESFDRTGTDEADGDHGRRPERLVGHGLYQVTKESGDASKEGCNITMVCLYVLFVWLSLADGQECIIS